MLSGKERPVSSACGVCIMVRDTVSVEVYDVPCLSSYSNWNCTGTASAAAFFPTDTFWDKSMEAPAPARSKYQDVFSKEMSLCSEIIVIFRFSIALLLLQFLAETDQAVWLPACKGTPCRLFAEIITLG